MAPQANSLFAPYRGAFTLLAVLIAAELVTAAFVGSYFLGVSTRQIFTVGDISLGLSGWLLIPLIWMGMAVMSLVRRQSNHPTKSLIRLLRTNRAWLVRGLLLSVIHIPLGQAFATFKSSIPSVNPFTWDHTFARLDRVLLGTDAWRITHSVIDDAGTVALDRIYALWGFYLVILAGWISFTRNRNIQIKAALTFNLCWFLLGSVMAVIFASSGPCFVEYFHGDRSFKPLMDELSQSAGSNELLSLRAMEYLIDNSGTTHIGLGISAMPSMHISIATLGVILTFAAGARTWVRALAFLSAATIMVGSVHLGWHYAVDGLASCVGTIIIWAACSWLVEATKQGRQRFTSPNLQVRDDSIYARTN